MATPKRTCMRGYRHGVKTELSIAVPLPIARRLALMPVGGLGPKMGKVPPNLWEWELNEDGSCITLHRVR